MVCRNRKPRLIRTRRRKKFSVTAYRFSDSTGSFAAWNAMRPADASKFEIDGIGRGDS